MFISLYTINFHTRAQLSLFVCLFRVVDNGIETVETYENDVLTSRLVNGQQQMLTLQAGPASGSSGGAGASSGGGKAKKKHHKFF